MEVSGLDRETSEAIMHEFCKQTARLIVDIQRLIAEDDSKEVGILLHKLKGSAGNVRVQEIAKLAFEAEKALGAKEHEQLGDLLRQIEESLHAFTT